MPIIEINGARYYADRPNDCRDCFFWKNNKRRCALKEHNCYYLTAPMPKVSNGVDLVTTANELGHANATTTAMIYAHQIAIAKARAADVRAGVFAGRDSKPKGSKLRSKFRGA